MVSCSVQAGLVTNTKAVITLTAYEGGWRAGRYHEGGCIPYEELFVWVGCD